MREITKIALFAMMLTAGITVLSSGTRDSRVSHDDRAPTLSLSLSLSLSAQERGC